MPGLNTSLCDVENSPFVDSFLLGYIGSLIVFARQNRHCISNRSQPSPALPASSSDKAGQRDVENWKISKRLPPIDFGGHQSVGSLWPILLGAPIWSNKNAQPYPN